MFTLLQPHFLRSAKLASKVESAACLPKLARFRQLKILRATVVIEPLWEVFLDAMQRLAFDLLGRAIDVYNLLQRWDIHVDVGPVLLQSERFRFAAQFVDFTEPLVGGRIDHRGGPVLLVRSAARLSNRNAARVLSCTAQPERGHSEGGVLPSVGLAGRGGFNDG
jgi:hypothetical protein